MRFFVLRKELLGFFQTKDHKHQKILKDKKFFLYFAYQLDIFGVVNFFNRYLRGFKSNIIDFAVKLNAFIRKLDLCIKNIDNKQFEIYENVTSLGEEPSIIFVQKIINEIKHYFFNDGDAQACTYTLNPFVAKPDNVQVGTGEQEELINLQCDEDAQQKILHFPISG